MPLANVKEVMRGYLEVIGQGSARPLEEKAMQLADDRPQFFHTQPRNSVLKDLTAEHGNGFGSDTATKSQFLTRRHLEECIQKKYRVFRG